MALLELVGSSHRLSRISRGPAGHLAGAQPASPLQQPARRRLRQRYVRCGRRCRNDTHLHRRRLGLGNPGFGITNPLVTLGDVAYGNGRFVAISSNSNTNVLTSHDWHELGQQSAWICVRPVQGHRFRSSKFVVVGTRGSTNFIMTSADGTNWNSQSSSVGSPLSGVTFAQSQFVAVGGPGTGSSNGVIVTSPDGVTWTTRRTNVQQTLLSVAGGSSGFVSVGGTTTAKSINGTTWTIGKARRRPVSLPWLMAATLCQHRPNAWRF